MINVLVLITTQPGRRAEVLDAFSGNIPLVLAEHGCHQYAAFIDPLPATAETPTPLGDDSFVIMEQWDDFSCLQAHRVAPHMKAYAAKTKDLIVSRVSRVLSAIAPSAS